MVSDRDQLDPLAIDAERDMTLLQQQGVGAENLAPPTVEAGNVRDFFKR